jgi:hypothetical protein
MNGSTPVGIFSVYERATGEKLKLSLERKGNINANSSYVLCFMCFDRVVVR